MSKSKRLDPQMAQTLRLRSMIEQDRAIAMPFRVAPRLVELKFCKAKEGEPMK